MTRFGSGDAGGADAVAAAERAAARALLPLGTAAPDVSWILVSGYPPGESAAALERASRRVGAGVRVGAAVGPPGLGGRVQVLAGRLPGVGARGFHLEVLPRDDAVAVVGLPDAPARPELTVLLADPWTFPLEGFADQLGRLGPGVSWCGGQAHPGPARGGARLLLDDRVVDRGAVGLRLAGPLGARVDVAPAARPVGPPMAVTAVEEGAVTGLAGRPAAALLRQLVATADPEEQALAGRGLLLGVAADEHAEAHLSGGWVLRPVLTLSSGRVWTSQPVPLGTTVRLHVADAEAAAAGGSRLAGRLEGRGLDQVEGALVLGSGLGTRLPLTSAAISAELGGCAGAAADLGAVLVGSGCGPVAVHGWSVALLAFGSGATADRGTGGLSG